MRDRIDSDAKERSTRPHTYCLGAARRSARPNRSRIASRVS